MDNSSFCQTLLSMCLPHLSPHMRNIQVWIYRVPFWNMTRNLKILSVTNIKTFRKWHSNVCMLHSFTDFLTECFCQKQSVSCPASRWKKVVILSVPAYHVFSIWGTVFTVLTKSMQLVRTVPAFHGNQGIHNYFPKSVLTCSPISAPLIKLGDGQTYRTFLRSLKKKIPISWTYLFPYISIQQHEKHFYIPMCIVHIWGGGCSLLSTQNK
jgi:hypothetical protein